MIIVIKSEQLKEVISKFSGFVTNANKKHNTSIMNTSIMIRCLDDRLVATTLQNYEFMFDVVLECVEHDINLSENRNLFLIPLKKISDLSKKMDCDNVILEYKDNYDLFITLNSTKVLYKIENCNMFATIETQDYDEVVFTKVASTKLINSINSCGFAMAVADSRSFLNGMLFRFDKDILKLVATDAHRLAYNEVEHGNGVIDGSVDYIVPYNVVKLLQKIVKNDDVINLQVKSGKTSNILIISCDDWIITAVCIDGKFPDYNRVIPTQNKLIIQLKTKDLKKLIDKVSIIGFDKLNTINLKYDNANKKFIGTVINETDDEITNFIDAVGLSIETNISFNFHCKYILDFVKNCNNDVFNICCYDSERSVLFTIPNDSVYKYVVMPLRS
jgi:DNA polymerase-3 subunit beta